MVSIDLICPPSVVKRPFFGSQEALRGKVGRWLAEVVGSACLSFLWGGEVPVTDSVTT